MLNPLPPLTDADLARLHTLLDTLPAPLQPMDVSALDGYLCGVLLQPQPVAAGRWLAQVSDVAARPAPPGPVVDELQALVLRRHAELDAAIGQREWFDPWIFPPGDDADADVGANADADAAEGDGDGDAASDTAMDASAALLPWVAGFAAAMELFPALMALDNPELVEPLAVLFMHFDADDLEDADALIAVIQTLEPPRDLAEAVQDLVRALMLIADVTRPRSAPPAARSRPPPARRSQRRSNPGPKPIPTPRRSR